MYHISNGEVHHIKYVVGEVVEALQDEAYLDAAIREALLDQLNSVIEILEANEDDGNPL